LHNPVPHFGPWAVALLYVVYIGGAGAAEQSRWTCWQFICMQISTEQKATTTVGRKAAARVKFSYDKVPLEFNWFFSVGEKPEACRSKNGGIPYSFTGIYAACSRIIGPET